MNNQRGRGRGRGGGGSAFPPTLPQRGENIKVITLDRKTADFPRAEIKKSPTLIRILTDAGFDLDRENEYCPAIYAEVENIDLLKACFEWIRLGINSASGTPSEDENETFITQHEKMLPAILVAAVYLDLPILADRVATKMAATVNGMTPSEMRFYFGISCDIPLEEYQAMERELEPLGYKPFNPPSSSSNEGK